jgi:hypothetical protein
MADSSLSVKVNPVVHPAIGLACSANSVVHSKTKFASLGIGVLGSNQHQRTPDMWRTMCDFRPPTLHVADVTNHRCSMAILLNGGDRARISILKF